MLIQAYQAGLSDKGFLLSDDMDKRIPGMDADSDKKSDPRLSEWDFKDNRTSAQHRSKDPLSTTAKVLSRKATQHGIQRSF